jgi:hypothetical protein
MAFLLVFDVAPTATSNKQQATSATSNKLNALLLVACCLWHLKKNVTYDIQCAQWAQPTTHNGP